MNAADLKANNRPSPVTLNPIDMHAPWRWLTKAWHQMWQVPHITLAYGAGFSLLSAGLFSLLIVADMLPLFLPLTGGFLLLGPLFAVGLYETAKRLSNGEPVSLRAVLLVKTASPSQIAFIGVCLLLAFFAWIRIAMLLFAFFAGINAAFPPLDVFFTDLFTTPDGLGLLISGTLTGGIIAFIIFSVSVLSIPLAMDRKIDAVTAILTSLEAVGKNIGPMLLWSWMIALLTAVGIATAFIGLAVTYPLLGLATWHGYKELTGKNRSQTGENGPQTIDDQPNRPVT